MVLSRKPLLYFTGEDFTVGRRRDFLYTICSSRGEPRLELGVHDFGIMWNYF